MTGKAWPRWFTPNWISYPSSVRPSGGPSPAPRMPAMQNSRSRRAVVDITILAAFSTEENDARLHPTKVTSTFGAKLLISEIVDSAVFELRAAM